MVLKTKLHFSARIKMELSIGRNVTKHDLNAKIYKCGFEKLHIHETSFIFFKHLIEESFFPWIWGFVLLCKSDNSFQMQIDFSIKLPNKKCNVFPCYIPHKCVCLLRNTRDIKLLSPLKCNNSDYSHYVFPTMETFYS